MEIMWLFEDGEPSVAQMFTHNWIRDRTPRESKYEEITGDGRLVASLETFFHCQVKIDVYASAGMVLKLIEAEHGAKTGNISSEMMILALWWFFLIEEPIQKD